MDKKSALDRIISALSKQKQYTVQLKNDQLEIASANYRTVFYIPVNQALESFKNGNNADDFLLMLEDNFSTSEIDNSRIYPLIKKTASIKN